MQGSSKKCSPSRGVLEGSPDQLGRDSSEASQLEVTWAPPSEHLLAPRNLGVTGHRLGAKARLRAVTRPTRSHRLKAQSWRPGALMGPDRRAPGPARPSSAVTEGTLEPVTEALGSWASWSASRPTPQGLVSGLNGSPGTW